MISRNRSQPVRSGAIASFANLEALSRGLEHVVSLLPAFDTAEYDQRYGGNAQPPNVLNLALRIFNAADDMSEADWCEKIDAFINSRRSTLAARGVRRVSIIIYTARIEPCTGPFPTETRDER